MKICDINHYPGFVEREIASHPMVVSNELLGLEIELEDISGNDFDSRYWRSVEDGSLRNSGEEFIFRAPIGGADLYRAIAEACKFFYKAQPDASWRCSTHVHLDVRSMEVKKFKNLLLVFTVYERPMFKCSGMNRYKNNFCPAYGFAQNQLMTLSKFWNLSDERFINRVVNTWAKYSALNLLPIADKGSVEFRISNALTSSSSLLRLCNRVLTLKKIATEWEGSHEDLIQHLLNTDVHEVFNKKLTGNLEIPITQEDVHFGAILANDIINLKSFRLAPSGGEVPTVLTQDKVCVLLEIAESRRRSTDNPRLERWQAMASYLLDVQSTGEFEHMSVEMVMEIKSLYSVSFDYIVAREEQSIFNDSGLED